MAPGVHHSRRARQPDEAPRLGQASVADGLCLSRLPGRQCDPRLSSRDGLSAAAQFLRQGCNPAPVIVRDPLKAAQLSVLLHSNSEPPRGVQVGDLPTDQLALRLHVPVVSVFANPGLRSST